MGGGHSYNPLSTLWKGIKRPGNESWQLVRTERLRMRIHFCWDEAQKMPNCTSNSQGVKNKRTPLIVYENIRVQYSFNIKCVPFIQKLYSNVLRTYKGILLILMCHEWLLQLHILCSLSHHNWLRNIRKLFKKHTSIDSKICVLRT